MQTPWFRSIYDSFPNPIADEIGGAVALEQESADLPMQIPVAPAGLVKICSTLVRSALEGRLVDLLDPLPAFAIHTSLPLRL
jgi:hypothetical protein